MIDKAFRICDNSVKKNKAHGAPAEQNMAENDVRSHEYRELPEHTSHAEYGPLNPDISCFRESAVTAAEENIFQGTVPSGEEENPFTAARRKKKDKKRYALLSKFLAGAVRAGAAAFGLLLLIGLIVLLNRDSSDSETALQVREILEAAQRPFQSVPDIYGPGEIGGVWAGDPAAPHKYDLEHPVIAKEAGCTEEGEIRFVCTECGIILKEALPAHGHVLSEKVTENEVASSCLAQGTADEVVYCSVCGEELSREKVARALGPHTPADPVEENRTEASCTEDGSFDTVVYCSLCHEELSRETTVLKATGHTEGEAVEENRSEASCTEDGGFDTVIYCEVCGEELSRETTVLEATGHTEGEAVEENLSEASCTEDGGFDTVIYCKVCGEELSRERTVIAAAGHDYTARVTAATCTAQGYTTHVCSRCGNSYVDAYTTALGHSYGAWTTTTAAACTAAGTERRTCSRCGSAETRSVSALGHDYTLSTGTCSRCGRNAIQLTAGTGYGTGTPVTYTIDSKYRSLVSSSGLQFEPVVTIMKYDSGSNSYITASDQFFTTDEMANNSNTFPAGNVFSGDKTYLVFRIYNTSSNYSISTNTVTAP